MIYKKIEIAVDGYKETADLYTYFLDNSIEMHINRKRPVVVICPGGGYAMTSDREAEPIAMQYLVRGYHAVILRYSVEPARYPLALLQLAKSVAFLRKNAAEFHIDTNKIVLQGFSAGGHLAASLGVFWKKDFIAQTLGVTSDMVKPNGMILSYPLPVSLHIQVPLNACLERIIMILIREKNSLWNSRYLKIHQPHSCGIQ